MCTDIDDAESMYGDHKNNLPEATNLKSSTYDDAVVEVLDKLNIEIMPLWRAEEMSVAIDDLLNSH